MSTNAMHYPVGPVRVIVPFPPGGSTEFTAQRLAEQLRNLLGQPFNIENRVGDFGIEAMRLLIDSDAHTLMVGSVNTNSIAPVVFRQKMDFDYVTRIRPISRLTEFPSVLITRPSVPANTLREFIEYGKRTWGKIRNGTDWIGSYPDIDGVILAREADFDIVNVTEPDGADGLLAALIADQIDMVFLNARTSGMAAQAGKVKALAVTGSKRLSHFPEVPTMAQSGFPGIGTTHWHGLFTSADTPEEIVRLLHGVVVRAMNTNEIAAKFANVGARVATSGSPEQFAAEIAAEMEQWKKVTAEIQLTVE
jgi:tripartite-type tricarboxylate transporter receptor subunit TctC